MKKYKVNNKWITRKEWVNIIYNEYDQIMKHQEMSVYGKNENGEDIFLDISLSLNIGE